MLRSTVSRQIRTFASAKVSSSSQMSETAKFPDEVRLFPKLQTGERIGPDSRYKILDGDPMRWFKKYGLWVALDEKYDKRVIVEAVKTEDLGTREIYAYERLSRPPPTPSFKDTHCISLIDNFAHFDKEKVGDHVCLVSELMGGNLNILRNNWSRIPFPLVKRILLHVLRGIAHMHSCGIVHTDINMDNILFDAHRLDIDNIINQLHPVLYLDDVMNATYFISNFVNAQCISSLGDPNEATDKDYRPPEIILKGPWNEKVDIWAFGCLVFDLAISKKLFRHLPHQMYAEDANKSHLWQIQRITGENFGAEQLKESVNAHLYFNGKGQLKYNPPNARVTFIRCLEGYNILRKKDVDTTASLLKRCLRVKPEDRATAKQLFNDPFWDDMT